MPSSLVMDQVSMLRFLRIQGSSAGASKNVTIPIAPAPPSFPDSLDKRARMKSFLLSVSLVFDNTVQTNVLFPVDSVMPFLFPTLRHRAFLVCHSQCERFRECAQPVSLGTFPMHRYILKFRYSIYKWAFPVSLKSLEDSTTLGQCSYVALVSWRPVGQHLPFSWTYPFQPPHPHPRQSLLTLCHTYHPASSFISLPAPPLRHLICDSSHIVVLTVLGHTFTYYI